MGYVVFAGIGVGIVAAGVALYDSNGDPVELTKNRGFDTAVICVGLLIFVYALREKLAYFASRPSSNKKSDSGTIPPRIRAFIAGGFTLMFFQGMVQGIWRFAASALEGKPEWLLLSISLGLGGFGVAVGLGLLTGGPRALQWARTWLALGVAGGCFGWVLSMLHILPPENAAESADVITSLALLFLLAWCKRRPIDNAGSA